MELIFASTDDVVGDEVEAEVAVQLDRAEARRLRVQADRVFVGRVNQQIPRFSQSWRVFIQCRVFTRPYARQTKPVATGVPSELRTNRQRR